MSAVIGQKHIVVGVRDVTETTMARDVHLEGTLIIMDSQIVGRLATGLLASTEDAFQEHLEWVREDSAVDTEAFRKSLEELARTRGGLLTVEEVMGVLPGK